jgi:hypothetical protein
MNCRGNLLPTLPTRLRSSRGESSPLSIGDDDANAVLQDNSLKIGDQLLILAPNAVNLLFRSKSRGQNLHAFCLILDD